MAKKTKPKTHSIGADDFVKLLPKMEIRFYRPHFLAVDVGLGRVIQDGTRLLRVYHPIYKPERI